MRIAGRTEDAALARELLAWLNDNHFTFLGYREYSWSISTPGPPPGRPSHRARHGAGAGHRPGHPARRPGRTRGLPCATAAGHPALSDDHHQGQPQVPDPPARLSGLHRDPYLRRGRPGDRRATLPRAVLLIRLLRERHPSAGAAAEGGRGTASGRATASRAMAARRSWTCWTPSRATSCSRPRSSELAAVVEKVAHLKERRQVRMFVRRDPYGRYLSCLVYLPRDRYTTAVRRRMEEILMRQLGGASIDYTARVTESVLARLHFVLRMPVGEAMGEVDVRALEKELTLATRSWNDEFADMIADSDHSDQLATLVGALPEGYKEDYTPQQAVKDLTALTTLSGRTRHVDGAVRSQPRGGRGGPAAQDLPPGRLDGAVEDPAAPDAARGGGDRRAALRAGARQRQASVHLRPGGHGPGRRRGGPEPLDDRGPAAVHGRVRRLVRRPQRAGRLQRAGDGRRPGLARRQPAARRRSLPAPGRGHLQPDLHRSRADGERRHRPPARPAVPDPVRPGAVAGPGRSGRPGRGADKGDHDGARRRGQPRPRPDHPVFPRHHLRRRADELLRLGPAGDRLQTAAEEAAGAAGAAPGVRDLRLLAAAGGRAPALRTGRPRRAAVVGPSRGLPDRDPRAGQGPDGEEHRDRAGRRQGRLLLQEAARSHRQPGRLAR